MSDQNRMDIESTGEVKSTGATVRSNWSAAAPEVRGKPFRRKLDMR
jgi:hypothetical protein